MLNAFRHHGLYRGPPPPSSSSSMTVCAQRLSASRIISGERCGDRTVSPVLNAFRHHGLYRPRLAAPRRSDQVLNAFRHHGLYRTRTAQAAPAGIVACSTPFGITDYIGCPRSPGAAGRSGAQRLSASRIISVGGRLVAVPDCRGAQRLSASRIISGRPRVGRRRLCTCAQRLSASRIISVDSQVFFVHESPRAQRLSASRIISASTGARPRLRFARVLNAFRHHGLYRASPGVGMSAIFQCAQRLSASRIISASGLGRRCDARAVLNAFRHHGLYRSAWVADIGARSRRCSTPFGITDYIGRRARKEPWQARDVLNAFRHHGLYRPRRAVRVPKTRLVSAQRLSASRIISGRRLLPAADHRRQVLNAFRHHGLYRARTTRSTIALRPCAQRLSASRIISAGVVHRDLQPQLAVLNAFRHHGLYRRRRPPPPTPGELDVLNAFRHHELYRPPWTGARVAPSLTPCSTPFGITDYIGLAFDERLQIAKGLCSTPLRDGCSTPFGITDYIGFGADVEPSGEVCAQRLSASRIISVAVAWQAIARPVRAQRLSASRIISAFMTARFSTALSLCSTPFGITDYIGISHDRPGRRAEHVLNAFRHHGLYRDQP